MSTRPPRLYLLVAAIFTLALFARLFGIAAESIWVDEAFSVAASQGELSHLLETVARDTHPPGYFLGLHLWRGVVPDTDAGLRAYSTLWSGVGLLFLLLLVRDTLGTWPALLAGLLMALNPLDLYFAQEARMYSQAAALASASAWLLWRWLELQSPEQAGRRSFAWAAGYAIAAAALLYSHYVTATLLLAQGLYALGCLASRRQWRGVAAYLALSLAVGLAFLPWLLYVLGFRDSFYASQVLSYMPDPTFEDYLSLPGREWVWGRVRQIHDHAWGITLLLPLSIFTAAAWTLRGRAADTRRREALAFVAWLVVAPLLLTALVGWAWETVYFRPRYSVLVLPGFLALLAYACTCLPSRALASAAALLCVGVMGAGSIAQHLTPQKRAWRETASHWPEGSAPGFYVIFPPEHQRALAHYLDGRIRHTPRAVLERLMPLPEGTVIWVGSWPEGPGPGHRDDLRWLQGLGGEVSHLLLPSYYSITQVTLTQAALTPAAPLTQATRPGTGAARTVVAGRTRSWFRPFDLRGGVSGFSDARRFSKIGFDAAGRAHRWSQPRAWLRLEEVRAGERVVLRAALAEGQEGAVELFASRRDDLSGLFESGPRGRFELRGARSRDLTLAAPPGSASLWVGWQLAGSSPADRLRIDGIGIEGGIADGVAGGIADGVAGGIADGIAGGIEGAAASHAQSDLAALGSE